FQPANKTPRSLRLSIESGRSSRPCAAEIVRLWCGAAAGLPTGHACGAPQREMPGGFASEIRWQGGAGSGRAPPQDAPERLPFDLATPSREGIALITPLSPHPCLPLSGERARKGRPGGLSLRVRGWAKLALRCSAQDHLPRQA